MSILIGSGSGGSGGPDKATGGVLDWPSGRILVGIAGLVIIGVGLEQGYKGIRRKFLEQSKTEQMSERVERAAIDYDPDKAVGLDGALNKLVHASYGPLLLGIVAAGLIGFAAYSVVDARYRRV